MFPVVLGLPCLKLHKPHINLVTGKPEKESIEKYNTHLVTDMDTSLIFFSGSLRSCIDDSGLNDITIKNKYPHPLIASACKPLNEVSILTQRGLTNVYHLVRIKEGEESKNGFNTSHGHFEYLVLPFKLISVPAVFKALVID